MKAIILTNAPVTDAEADVLKNTEIKKFAINAHAEYLKPDFRICADYDGVASFLLEHFPQQVITTREWVPDDRLIYAGDIPFKGSTMIACIDYLVKNNFNQILIIGTNTVHEDFFQKRINTEIKTIIENHSDVLMFQYSNGNFNLPIISTRQFVNVEENKLWDCFQNQK